MYAILSIGNEMDMTMLELGDILPNASVMIVSVTGSTTSGQPLPEADLADCFRACDEGEYACLVVFLVANIPSAHVVAAADNDNDNDDDVVVLRLDEDKASILKFVESRMSYIAPNLSHMIGDSPHPSFYLTFLSPSCCYIISNVAHIILCFLRH